MKYKKFIIKKYRAIKDPLEINLEKSSLIPIIGINECGKTTILQAIFAFDFLNDSLNNGIHLESFENLYDPSSQEGVISAEIEISWDEIKKVLNESDNGDNKNIVKKYKRKKAQYEINKTLVISRNLQDKKYNIEDEYFNDPDFNDEFSRKILRKLPYTLYFDDFRDSVDDKIEIKEDNDDGASG